MKVGSESSHKYANGITSKKGKLVTGSDNLEEQHKQRLHFIHFCFTISNFSNLFGLKWAIFDFLAVLI